MPVTGAAELSRLFREAGPAIRRRIVDAVEDGAAMILADMKAMAPRQTGQLAAALTYRVEDGGLAAHIGLPTRELASDYFYARFLIYGTKGGEVRYRLRGSLQHHTMHVPARPARPFMQQAFDLNRDDLLRLLNRAAQDGLREAAARVTRRSR